MSRPSEGRNFAATELRLIARSHGTGDAQKVMGVITLALVAGGYLQTLEVPWWVVLLAALAMGLGTAARG